MRLKILLLLLFISLPVLLMAQRSSETVKINGQIYYMHTIKEGETIEEIAKLYNVAPVDVVENNPTMIPAGELKAGMRLRIPDLKEISKDYPLSQWDFIYYQVKSQKKLKDIAKEYNVDVKDIKKNNVGIANKPAILTKIRIPIKKGFKYVQNTGQRQNNIREDSKDNPAISFNWGEDSGSSENIDTEKETDNWINKECAIQEYDSKTKYTVSYLLPLNVNETTKKDYSHVAFLEGSLLALEQMMGEGFSANVNIKDISSRDAANKITSDKLLAESDLIIGPFAPAMIRPVANFSKENNIPLISPYDLRTEVLAKDNPNFIQIYPAKESLDKNLFNRTTDDLVNVVLIYSATTDTAMLKMYREEIKKTFPGTCTEYNHVMGMNREKWRATLSTILKRDMNNLLFVASNEEAFVSDLLDRLIIVNPNKNKPQYPISLYGTSSWRKNFKNVNITNYYALNMHVTQAFFLDYNDEGVKAFIRKYRETYNNEPSQYAFQGYDITYYFMTALKRYGSDFIHCLPNMINVKLLQSKYKFERIYGNEGGLVNTDSFLLEYTPDMDIIKH